MAQHSKDYIHCNGTQLRLTDSDLGSEQYKSTDYYVWPSGSSGQLLFIFPTRVNLTTITLYYYSNKTQGLPRLRFFITPDDFDIWDAPPASYAVVEVAKVSPVGEPAGQRNTSVHFNFRTKKVLLLKSGSSYSFAVSELEFFACNSELIQQIIM